MASRRGRFRKSYVLEFALTGAVLLALYLFMTNGGPAWFGQWMADAMTR